MYVKIVITLVFFLQAMLAFAEHETLFSRHHGVAYWDRGLVSDIRLDESPYQQVFEFFHTRKDIGVYQVTWLGPQISEDDAKDLVFQISFHNTFTEDLYSPYGGFRRYDRPVFRPIVVHTVPVTVKDVPENSRARASIYTAIINPTFLLGNDSRYAISISLAEGELDSGQEWSWYLHDTLVPSALRITRSDLGVRSSSTLDFKLEGFYGRSETSDLDGDSIFDIYDICADSVSGAVVDSEGCAANQRDTDSDGLTDDIDQCVITTLGEDVDETGCSATQRDSDGDGHLDAYDSCPNSMPGHVVNTDGC